ncbi:MAG: hypothetical protein NVS4B11_28710 [Ktedonobacteraceae bacterium]
MLDYTETSSVVSVSELSLYLKELLDRNDILQNIWVHGEISNCKTYGSGHCYFHLERGRRTTLVRFL